ncbi:MAG: MFS transporter, partial [Clostridiales Family XIII bacterium]|nr:MFS transporter [Clostridiales Family XIII bacterium]
MRERRATLFVALVTNFVNPFAGTALNVAVPAIGAEFGSAATELTWIVSAYMFFTVALSVPFGRIADIRGKRGVLIWGTLIFSITNALLALSPSMPVFILFRCLSGIGGAMIFATSMPILVDAYPAQMRGKMIGITVGMVYVGLAAGPVVGGLMTEHFGWRGIVLVIAVVTLVAFFATVFFLTKKPAPDAAASGVGPVSILLFAVSMILFLYGLTTLSQHIWSYVTLALGIAVFAVFVKHESKTPAPLVEMRVFRSNGVFIKANVAALFNYAATFAVSYQLAIYLQLVTGMSADRTGIALIAQPVVMAIVAPISGRLSDRHSPFLLASLGMGICAAGLVLFTFLGLGTPLWYILL